MDFTPSGYIALSKAIERVLRATHGDDWGNQEIDFESNKVSIPGALYTTGQQIEGQPLDREAVATMSKQVRHAWDRLLSALSLGDIVGKVEIGTPVPKEYWQTTGARTTMSTGLLELGGGAKPEDMRWHHRRVIVEVEKFNAWLDGKPGDARKPRYRQPNIERDATVRNKIESVLAAAIRLWPQPDKMPGRNQAARLLAEDSAVRETGYKEPTLRKILSDNYSASKRLNISGYPDSNIRKK